MRLLYFRKVDEVFLNDFRQFFAVQIKHRTKPYKWQQKVGVQNGTNSWAYCFNFNSLKNSPKMEQ